MTPSKRKTSIESGKFSSGFFFSSSYGAENLHLIETFEQSSTSIRLTITVDKPILTSNNSMSEFSTNFNYTALLKSSNSENKIRSFLLFEKTWRFFFFRRFGSNEKRNRKFSRKSIVGFAFFLDDRRQSNFERSSIQPISVCSSVHRISRAGVRFHSFLLSTSVSFLSSIQFLSDDIFFSLHLFQVVGTIIRNC